jgi:hypothetical protein
MALVIDAIELLNSKIYDGFVIVSSDSDYTPLSIKLHESGSICNWRWRTQNAGVFSQFLYEFGF